MFRKASKNARAALQEAFSLFRGAGLPRGRPHGRQQTLATPSFSFAQRASSAWPAGLFRACSENSPGGDRGYRGNQRVVSRPKKSSGLAKPSGAAMRTGWRGRWLRPRQGGAVQPDSIGHWLFAERQIHRIYSSDHACRMQTILLEPFTCKRVHATLHSRIFCMGLMLISTSYPFSI